MSKLTLDEAIKHCLEVAEKNDGEAEVYDLLAKNHNNQYEKLTASRFYTDCAECAADHRQLAKWLMELKDARATLNDCGVEIEMLLGELREAKRLLKLAVEDMNDNNICYDINPCNVCTESKKCPCDTFKWRYTDEALKLIGEE